ncbi:MAG: ChbG/HpnK family deacetylase [Candidatus Omnitrophota bacterium]|nr:ChbG/HpnK family deacetylase [Candidatus Omnitrophota bacterium]
MKYLIVSADDLGLAESINRGIIKSGEEGIVTSMNVIASGGAFYDAMAMLMAGKSKEIGAHLALTETAPVSAANKIPTLINSAGKFHKSYPGFLTNLLRKKIDPSQVYIELKSQMERIAGGGIPVTSLSSHQHIHMLPGILEIFIRLAKEYNIPSVRYLHNDKFLFPVKGNTHFLRLNHGKWVFPFTFKKIFKKMIIGYFDGRLKKALDGASLKYTDNFLGFFDSGNIREEILIGMLDKLPEGVTELVTHPGFISAEVLDRCIFHKNCEIDLAALTSRRVRKAIADNGIKLISFGEFARLAK